MNTTFTVTVGTPLCHAVNSWAAHRREKEADSLTLRPAPAGNLFFLGSILRNVLRLSAFMSFSEKS